MFHIIQANQSHLDEIMNIIKILTLDSLLIHEHQFCVAVVENKVIGIGRVKTINGIKELCTLGVLDEYRNKGIGTDMVNFLKLKCHSPIYLVTDIPQYFSKLGFIETQDFPKEMHHKQKLCLHELQCHNPKVMIYHRLDK